MTDPWGDPDPDRTWRPGVEGAAGTPAYPDPPAYPAGDFSYFPPPTQQAVPWEPPPRGPRLARALATFAGTAAVLTLLGAPLALLWRAVAPPAVVLRTASGPQLAAPESNQLFAMDGWFVVVSVGVGLVAGALAWLCLRDRGPAAAFGLAAGGLLAASVAAAVGRRLVVDRYLYEFCDGRCLVYDGTLNLHAQAAVVALPVAMLTAFAALTAVLSRE